MKNWIKHVVVVGLLAGGLLAVTADEAEARHRRWRRCCRPVCCVSHCHSYHQHSNCCCQSSFTHSYADTGCCSTGQNYSNVYTSYHSGH